eukprot:TRINITY_DN445_c0_g1_i1.p1 TRINITY_DN445_c0_g1~~TRINITY_DN445_c0_g1_i1.p1  ORF type:complete len:83 (-),score=9.11 TRINITY_DN445_c0_g1_i1:239-487(-)
MSAPEHKTPFTISRAKTQGQGAKRVEKIAIDASIVKIMKRYKTLHHQKLVHRCLKDLRRFRVTDDQIQVRLTHLIDLDFPEY